MSAQRLEGVLSSKESAFRTMQRHWVLARMGKKMLCPGGIELTKRMVEFLAIGPRDEVVEFAPGLGVTARLTLARNPLSYTAEERDDMDCECRKIVISFGLKIGLFFSHRLTQTDTDIFPCGP